jgi:hypothetical protein
MFSPRPGLFQFRTDNNTAILETFYIRLIAKHIPKQFMAASLVPVLTVGKHVIKWNDSIIHLPQKDIGLVLNENLIFRGDKMRISEECI